MGPLRHFVATEIVAVAEIKGFASFACCASEPEGLPGLRPKTGTAKPCGAYYYVSFSVVAQP